MDSFQSQNSGGWCHPDGPLRRPSGFRDAKDDNQRVYPTRSQRITTPSGLVVPRELEDGGEDPRYGFFVEVQRTSCLAPGAEELRFPLRVAHAAADFRLGAGRAQGHVGPSRQEREQLAVDLVDHVAGGGELGGGLREFVEVEGAGLVMGLFVFGWRGAQRTVDPLQGIEETAARIVGEGVLPVQTGEQVGRVLARRTDRTGDRLDRGRGDREVGLDLAVEETLRDEVGESVAFGHVPVVALGVPFEDLAADAGEERGTPLECPGVQRLGADDDAEREFAAHEAGRTEERVGRKPGDTVAEDATHDLDRTRLDGADVEDQLVGLQQRAQFRENRFESGDGNREHHVPGTRDGFGQRWSEEVVGGVIGEPVEGSHVGTGVEESIGEGPAEVAVADQGNPGFVIRSHVDGSSRS